MKQKLNSILAICIGILPINILMIGYRLTQTEGFTISEMLVYPLVFGSGSILVILALNKYLLGEKLIALSPGRGKWQMDIFVGIVLTAIYFILFFIERATITKLISSTKPPSQEIINLMTNLAKDPVLLAIWLGPVVWIGVALFEELQRVFFLNCLWRLSDKKIWQLSAVLIVAITWGSIHLYQGTFGIISVSIQGLVMGLYFYKFKRIWPLLISHALYDSTQIIMFVVQVS